VAATRDERIRGKIIIVSMKIRGITMCLLLPSSRGVAFAAVVPPFSCSVTDDEEQASDEIFRGEASIKHRTRTVSLECCSPYPHHPAIISSVSYSLSQLIVMKRDGR